jgi:uncharacterized protein
MGNRFLPHNTHLENPDLFPTLDPHLRQLSKLPLVYCSDLVFQFMHLAPGIYTISGGKQVGKTTVLKQWMAQLIKEKTHPQNILYTTGELFTRDPFSSYQTLWQSNNLERTGPGPFYRSPEDCVRLC